MDPRTVNEVPWRNDLIPPGRARWSALQTMPVEGCPITMEGVESPAAVAGVTVRRPFADIDLWEFFLSLPAEIKYPDLRSKTLLRQLLRGRDPRRDSRPTHQDIFRRSHHVAARLRTDETIPDESRLSCPRGELRAPRDTPRPTRPQSD